MGIRLRSKSKKKDRLQNDSRIGANNVPIAEAGDTLSNLLKDRRNFLLADQGETRKKMGAWL